MKWSGKSKRLPGRKGRMRDNAKVLNKFNEIYIYHMLHDRVFEDYDESYSER